MQLQIEIASRSGHHHLERMLERMQTGRLVGGGRSRLITDPDDLWVFWEDYILRFGTSLVDKMAYYYLDRLDGHTIRQLQGYTRRSELFCRTTHCTCCIIGNLCPYINKGGEELSQGPGPCRGATQAG